MALRGQKPQFPDSQTVKRTAEEMGTGEAGLPGCNENLKNVLLLMNLHLLTKKCSLENF